MAGGDQNFEQLNVERPIFRTSKISNIKRMKDELFDYIIFDFLNFDNCLNYSKYMIYTRKIENLQNFEIFRNCKICEMFRIFQNKIFEFF